MLECRRRWNFFNLVSSVTDLLYLDKPRPSPGNDLVVIRKIMKTETRKQLIGIILGVAIGYGINQIPDLSSEAKMSVVVISVLTILTAGKALKQ